MNVDYMGDVTLVNTFSGSSCGGSGRNDLFTPIIVAALSCGCTSKTGKIKLMKRCNKH